MGFLPIERLEALRERGLSEDQMINEIMRGASADDLDTWARYGLKQVIDLYVRAESRATERNSTTSAEDEAWEREKKDKRNERSRQYRERDKAGLLDDYRAHRWDYLGEILSKYRAQITLQVTEELLGTKIALGDGVVVTWGDATVEQLNQRIEMLKKMASGNLESAARLVAARDMIEEAGVTCLRELPVLEEVTR